MEEASFYLCAIHVVEPTRYQLERLYLIVSQSEPLFLGPCAAVERPVRSDAFATSAPGIFHVYSLNLSINDKG